MKVRPPIAGAYIAHVRMTKNESVYEYNVQGQVIAIRFKSTLAAAFDLKDADGTVLAEHPVVHGDLELPDGTIEKPDPWTDAEIAAALSALYLELSVRGKQDLAAYPSP